MLHHGIRYVCILAALFASLWLMGAPPTASQDAAIDYYSPDPGNVWIYKTNDDCRPEVTIKLDTVSKRDDNSLVLNFVESTPPDKWIPHNKLLLTKNGIYRIEVAGEKIDPPFCVLKLPHIAKQEWTDEGDMPDAKKIATNKAIGSEEVVVPAGKFMAIRVERTLEIAIDTHYFQQDWFAPGVGCVKKSAGELTYELKQFIPVKKKAQ